MNNPWVIWTFQTLFSELFSRGIDLFLRFWEKRSNPNKMPELLLSETTAFTSSDIRIKSIQNLHSISIELHDLLVRITKPRKDSGEGLKTEAIVKYEEFIATLRLAELFLNEELRELTVQVKFNFKNAIYDLREGSSEHLIRVFKMAHNEMPRLLKETRKQMQNLYKIK